LVILDFVLILTGHVDAGKSTLMGRLLYELKAVDERTMQKYRQESQKAGKGSFALAWIMDQSDEERKRFSNLLSKLYI
jgi:elongation factor 1 alpha-like protein